ncbi:hypothetical protein [Actinoplanes sp. L3-i22]|uniref:hypothetical protein n=1 Tax=Actinoplanes sp. L3-i22 TaxID=2836373 RepID=UPI001C849744|nr:hypothetical protein [Actinoplanes sp. L3-i22]
METPSLDPSRDISFPVFDAVREELGEPAWDGWMETRGAVVGVARVRGGAPDDENKSDLPGVTVWSFAPERLSGVYSGPSLQAVLAFSDRFAESQHLSVPDATEQLIELVSSGGALVTATIDGNPTPGRMFEIPGLGWLVTSVEPAHAFAATFFHTPATLNFQRLTHFDN